MNSPAGYTLVSRFGTDRAVRDRRVLAGEILLAVLIVADCATVVATAVTTGIAYHWFAYGETGDLLSYFQVGVLAASILTVSNLFRGEYRLTNFFTFSPHVRRSVQLWCVTFVVLLTIGFLTKLSVGYSRGWIALFFFAGVLALLNLRYAEVGFVRRASAAGLVSTRRIFLLGSAPAIADFIQHYEPRTLGIQVVGCRFLTPVADGASPDERRETLRLDLDDAVHCVRHLEPDAIYIVSCWSDAETIDGAVKALLSVPTEIHLGPEPSMHRFNGAQVSRLGPISSLQITRRPLSRVEILQKRLFDLVFASVGLVLLTPLLLVVAALIKLDSAGPVFFLQQRYGFNQKPFRIIKFRTMRTLDDGAVIRQATKDDPRITRVGRWLRRFNVDEIPQLFNVLKGDMSLVGPRPHALSHNREYEQKISIYARRHNVKPGITGWAQVHGFRGETDTDEKMLRRVEHDLYYIDNWSVRLDFLIVLRTALSRAAYRNAY